MPYWRQEFSTGYKGVDGSPDITGSQGAQIVSILSAGTFFGALAAAPLADFAGRRMALIVSAGIVFNLGVILQTAATAIPMFTAGRFFAGFGVGLISALSMSTVLYPRALANINQSRYTNLKLHPNGSEVLSSDPTNSPSLLDFSSQPS